RGGGKTGEVANHPLAVVKLPIHRRAPVFAVDCFPTFRKPPAKVFISALAHEFEVIAVADERAVDGEVASEDLVRRLLVVPGKFVFVRVPVAQPKQATFDFSHTFDFADRVWPRLNGSIE